MFLRNYWYVAATADELGRKLLPRWVLGEPIVLYRRNPASRRRWKTCAHIGASPSQWVSS